MSYDVDLTPKAKRALRKLSAEPQRRVGKALRGLGEDPFSADAERVVSEPGALRARVGDYRVIYRVDNDRRLVQVLDVARRDEAYRPR